MVEAGRVAEHRKLSASAIVLAVESATPRASVALMAGERVLAERRSDAGRHHSETLLPSIVGLLGDAGVSLGEVEGFAISIGPGAFTSLRIGLSTVKGLCFGSTVPVVAVPTLRGLASTAWRNGVVAASGVVVPVLDARRGEVYVAAYRRDPDDVTAGIELLPASVLDPERLARALPEGGCLVGDGTGIVCGELERLAPGRFEHVADGTVEPDAVTIGLLALREFRAGRGVDAATLVPRYVRRAEAEVVRTRERFE
jgi:tRNA threonylcarbamoyladenosine biosynthesis protein TsaB